MYEKIKTVRFAGEDPLQSVGVSYDVSKLPGELLEAYDTMNGIAPNFKQQALRICRISSLLKGCIGIPEHEEGTDELLDHYKQKSLIKIKLSRETGSEEKSIYYSLLNNSVLMSDMRARYKVAGEHEKKILEERVLKVTKKLEPEVLRICREGVASIMQEQTHKPSISKGMLEVFKNQNQSNGDHAGSEASPGVGITRSL